MELTYEQGRETISDIERYASLCYKGKTRPRIQNLIASGHESTIEHRSVTAIVVCDRGVSHEIVRHRLASYSQESTRYCNYSNERFGGEITVIKPLFFDMNTSRYSIWEKACLSAEKDYFTLLDMGATPQEARTVLPTSLKTEIAMTMNLREWRHFFSLRWFGLTGKPHPQMLEVAAIMYSEFNKVLPEVFS